MVTSPLPKGWIMKRRLSAGAAVESLLLEYFELNTSIRSEKTRGHYRRAVHWLEKAIGRPAKVSDLTDENLTRLMNWLLREREQMESTVNTSHKCLRALANFARDRGDLQRVPVVRPLRCPETQPDSWSDVELQQLLTAAAHFPNSYGPVPGRVWWRALLAMGIETAERSGAILSVRPEWVDLHGRCLRIPPHARKGGLQGATYRLSPWAIESLQDLLAFTPRGSQSLFDCKPSTYFKRWDVLLSFARLPAGYRCKLQKIRRTIATLAVLAKVDPRIVLRHKTPGLAYRHYVDESRTQQDAMEWLPGWIAASGGAITGPFEPLGIS